jgi:hypothetical protein
VTEYLADSLTLSLAGLGFGYAAFRWLLNREQQPRPARHRRRPQ